MIKSFPTSKQTAKLIVSSLTGSHPKIQGWLYISSYPDVPKWSKRFFFLSSSGLFYYPTKGLDEAVKVLDLSQFDVYTRHRKDQTGGWYGGKAPLEWVWGLKAQEKELGSNKEVSNHLKVLCCEDSKKMEDWVLTIRAWKVSCYLLELAV